MVLTPPVERRRRTSMVDVALHFDIFDAPEVRSGGPRWACLSGLANTTRSGAATPAHERVGSAAPT